MAYEKHTWKKGEEPSLESLNHIERGIADAESSANAQFTALPEQAQAAASNLVPLNGSAAMTENLSITNTGRGVAFDNGNTVLADSAGIKISAPSVTIPGVGNLYTSKKARIVGQTDLIDPNFFGSTTMTITRVRGRNASGVFVNAPRSSGVPIDNPDGSAWYMLYCTACFSGGYNDAFRSSLAIAGTGYQSPVTYGDQKSYGTDADGLILFCSFAAQLASGISLRPLVTYERNFTDEWVARSYSVQATLVAVRLR